MKIEFDDIKKTFHLQNDEMSYILDILNNEQPGHVYWGRRIEGRNIIEKPESDHRGIPDALCQEYPAYGRLDFRYPAYKVLLENGSRITDLKFNGYSIEAGKDKIKGLPATYVETDAEARTLSVELLDEVAGLRVILKYTLFADYPALARRVIFENTGEEKLVLQQALSACVDFPDDNYQIMQLSGTWARERHPVKRNLEQGVVAIDSKRGCSSHEQNPFLAVMRAGADEFSGEVFGFSLVYSGNFLARAEVNRYHQTRITMGINPFDFSWKLEPKASFRTPEVVMVYSDEGLNKMSQTYHRLYRTGLARGNFRDRERPILLNNWEATYFDFDTDKLLKLAREAAELGIELFVLDDGWFGNRNDDTTSLGDWYVNQDKLPGGLSFLGEKLNEMGLEFGLWFEPEMVSPVSELYEQHPDWCIHVPDRKRSRLRNQLILDLSRLEVREYIIDRVAAILEEAPVSYVKWDMNRQMSEIGSPELPVDRQQETAHRYLLGLYQILEEITTRFPEVLFESCAGGGGRFDPGMLHYMPQTWTSDNTDAVERLKIQYGTSLVYPLSSMGAHVSAVPNHQVGRITPLQTRGQVAMFGNFGYELDITELSAAEKEQVKQQIKTYKQVRGLVQQGDFYRLLSPFCGEETAWVIVSGDKSRALLGYYKVLAQPNPGQTIIKLKGLAPDKKYQLSGSEPVDGIYGGDELMYAGLRFYVNGFENYDFRSYLWQLESVD